MCALGIIRESNKTVLGLSFWFLFWNYPSRYVHMRIFLIGKGSSSAASTTNPGELEINTISGYNSTETVSGISRNLRKVLTLKRWSCIAAQNILISRVSIQKRYFFLHSGISPLATSSHTNISFQQIKSINLSWKPHFVQFWCGRTICRRQMMA